MVESTASRVSVSLNCVGQELTDHVDFRLFLLGEFEAPPLLVHPDRFLALLHHGLQHLKDLVVGDAAIGTLAPRGDVAVLQRGQNQAQCGDRALILRAHRLLESLIETLAEIIRHRIASPWLIKAGRADKMKPSDAPTRSVANDMGKNLAAQQSPVRLTI